MKDGECPNGATLREVGAALGVSVERARQIEGRALRTMYMRLRNAGISREEAVVEDRSAEDTTGTYLRSRQCSDCLVGLPDARRARCTSCEQYETARRDGLADGAYERQVLMRGVVKILSRWPGTTT